jgi:hypothetical protein
MKNTAAIFLSASLLLAAFALQAQNDRQQRTFEGGIVAGFNMAQIDGDLLYGFNKLGINAGLRANALLSERWHLGVELLFSQQGATRSNKDNPASPFDRIHLNYVEAPVLLCFREWKIEASGGLSYSRLINYKITDAVGDDATAQIPLKENNVSLLLGATFFVQENFGINAYWSRSLNNFREGGISGPGSAANTGRFFNRAITIRGMYLF